MNDLDAIMELPGWCSHDKAVRIYDEVLRLAQKSPQPFAGVEIGVFGGRSLLAAGLALRDGWPGFLLGIDPYTHDSALESVQEKEHIEWWGKEDLRSVRVSCEAAIRALKLSRYCGVVYSPAENVAPVCGELNYLHIDGNHSVEVAARDVRLWLPKLRAGGTLIMDDVHWPGVAATLPLINSLCSVQYDGTTWMLFRRKE